MGALAHCYRERAASERDGQLDEEGKAELLFDAAYCFLLTGDAPRARECFAAAVEEGYAAQL